MSETNEQLKKPPSEQPDEQAGEDELTDVSIVTSKKDSDVSMIEDEEMPTYSSISSSMKPNNSVTSYDPRMNDIPIEKNRSPSPEPSEEQDNEDNESVYVVSSTADTDRNPDDIEDEEEEEDDYESDDMNEEDEEDEDDEDDDGQDEYDNDRFERESDDFAQDRFERASDDFVLRHNDGIKKYKERSLSLQDLTTMEARYNRRRNLSRHQYYGDTHMFKPNVYSSFALNSKPYQGSRKYEHVESKVKRYIQDIKEQEKLTKLRNPVNIKDSKDNRAKPVTGGKQIKEYAEKVIQELEQKESSEIQISTYATLEPMENGKERESLKLHSERNSTDVNIPMEVDHSPTNKQSNDKFEKVNGIIQFGEESEVTCTPIMKEVSFQKANEQINGADSSKNLINLRTLSYEEYMRGVPEEVEEVEEVEEDEEVDEEVVPEAEIEIEPTEICLISSKKMSCETVDAKENNDNTNNSMKLLNVKSNCHDLNNEEYKYKDKNPTKMINQATETIKVENSEIKTLQASLTQRNTQFEHLQVAYQKTLSENLAMKQELESLKKMLKKHEEYQNRETKCTFVQTEKIGIINSQKDNITEEKDKIKMSTSSLTSAISSIHQWSESGFSPSISATSPDVRKTFNSDDSIVFDNTPKHPRTLSRAFITSSRILQTLSNITQKKWNASSPISQDGKNHEKQSTEDASTSGTPLNSKKRKATEMLGVSSSEQPFKIPHTSGSGRKKVNQDSSNESFQMNGMPSQNENSVDDSKNENDDEGKNMKKELGEDLKYYIYQDEENSKERNFLIQAEETGKIPNKGAVRECGPYLLGNLEVRMTEVNGTINIWGKELNIDSTEEDSNLFGKTAEAKPSLCWQKTAQTNLLNNSFMSSTNKNIKSQSRFNDSNISQFSHLLEYSIPKSSLQMNRQSCHRRGSLTSDDNCSSHNHRLSWSGCKHLLEEQKHYHSRPANLSSERCNCVDNVRRCEYSSCSKNQGCAENIRRHSFSGGSNKTSMDSHYLNNSNHCSKSGNESFLRHQRSPCQSSPYDEEDNFRHFSKQCHSSRGFAHSCSPKNISNSECRDNCCQSRNFITQEDETLISTQQDSLEPPEIRRKRLSGKKVRTLLMDLLKGCGDCRTPNPANMSKSNVAGRESIHMSACPPEIIVTPCSPRASYSSQSQSMEKNRCCDTCSRRFELSAEIEAQLEFFRIEMERLRSSSDALLNKIYMLNSADIN